MYFKTEMCKLTEQESMEQKRHNEISLFKNNIYIIQEECLN